MNEEMITAMSIYFGKGDKIISAATLDNGDNVVIITVNKGTIENPVFPYLLNDGDILLHFPTIEQCQTVTEAMKYLNTSVPND